MHRRAVLGVLGTVAAGGCLRLESGTTTRSEGTEPATRTTEPVATTAATTERADATEQDAETTSAEPQYPRGLGEDGAELSLADFHESTLEETSFRVEWSKLDRDDGGFKWRKRYRSEGDRAVGRATTRAMGGPTDVYRTADDGSFWREDLGDGYTYGREDRDWNPDDVLWRDEMTPLVRGTAWSAPERVNDDRPAVWELSADGVRDASVAPGYYDGEFQSVSGTLRVDERGFVSSVDASYRVRKSGASGGNVRRFRTRFAVDAVGETSVSEPDWVAAAESRAPTISAPVTDDGLYVAFTVESGNRIEANSIVTVYDVSSETSYGLRLDAPVEPGETVYLYRFRESSGFPQLRASRGERPDSEPSLAFESTYDVWSRRATLTYAKVYGE